MTRHNTILALARHLDDYADEMMDLPRALARGENVAAERMSVQVALDVVTALIGGLRREAR